MIVDATGSVWLFDANRAEKYLRRWRTGVGVPAGQPTSPLVVQSDPNGGTLVAYTSANRFLVCLDPDREAPVWVVSAGEDAGAPLVGAPQAVAGGGWLVTDLSGRVTLYSAVGKPQTTLEVRLPGAVPAVAGRLLGSASVLAALSDGSSVVVPLPAPMP